MKSVTFTAYGQPVPQSRPRVSRYGTYYPAKVKAYREYITTVAKAAMRGREPLQGALECKCKFFFEPPKSVSKKKASAMIGTWHMVKKDTDNLIKSVTDSISGIVYVDDKQIVSLHGEKKYGYPARVEVEICEK